MRASSCKLLSPFREMGKIHRKRFLLPHTFLSIYSYRIPLGMKGSGRGGLYDCQAEYNSWEGGLQSTFTPHVIRNFSTLDQGGNDPPRNRRKYVVSLASAWQRHSLAVGVGSGLCGRKRRLEVSEVASSGRGKRGEGGGPFISIRAAGRRGSCTVNYC